MAAAGRCARIARHHRRLARVDRVREQARVAFQRTSAGGATVTDARYHGVDDKGRPYTVTAATAQQDGPDRVNLTMPKADITLGDGTWMMVQSKRGVYLQQSSQLDLSRDVTLCATTAPRSPPPALRSI